MPGLLKTTSETIVSSGKRKGCKIEREDQNKRIRTEDDSVSSYSDDDSSEEEEFESSFYHYMELVLRSLPRQKRIELMHKIIDLLISLINE